MSVSINGSNGLTFSDGTTQNTAGFVPFRNRIINGAMRVAQRATSATITAGSTIAAGYSTVDRFYTYCTGANVTAAQVNGTGTTMKMLQITGAAGVTGIGVGQRIEQQNCYDMAGSTATLSVDLANSLLTSVTWTAYYATTADSFGTLAAPTRTQIATGTFTVNATKARYRTNIAIPAGATTGIEIVFTVGAQTSGTWTIDDVQFELGSVDTPFEVRPYGTELALCQRYYENNGSGWFTTSSNYGVQVYFRVTKRATPTIAVNTGAVSGSNYIGTNSFRMDTQGPIDVATWSATSEL